MAFISFNPMTQDHANGGADIAPLARQGVPMLELIQDASGYFDYHHTANDTFDKIRGDESYRDSYRSDLGSYYGPGGTGYRDDDSI